MVPKHRAYFRGQLERNRRAPVYDPNRWPGRLPPGAGNGERTMCDKCVEIDKKTDHYRQLAKMITDAPTLDGIKVLIEKMKAEKAALHPEQK